MSEGNFFTPDELRVKLESFCAYQERCEYEIRLKLKALDANPEHIESVLLSLKENRFWDELRFAKAYAQGKLRIKRWGRNKIKQGLLQKFVAKNWIQEAIYTLDEEEYESALRALMERKWKETSKEKESWKRKVKCVNYCLSRGFEQDLVFSIFHEVQQASNDGYTD